ncbi:hypothetical protein Poli38472_012781 [Pythium oligandrum]|uniref:Homeobox domain-containing protein n=1 Tax=Pythium oligandrum TaxID=41045 RepID=A0A8K1FFF3_PYTOL|nr:hypothetical protein Poli38472_012781 [Pythium oligandrum]|eukprot:TMW61590.1 hypothetical protein Poli38472_012781 [Pythium oligandrum]
MTPLLTPSSPATSTDSRADDVAVLPSPSKLPGLHFAITHRRADLRLPSLASQTGGALHLAMPQCETPHYLPGVPTCPETSPTDKKLSDMKSSLDAKKRKKGTRRGTLNADAKNVLKAWMFSPEHFAHPYPSEEEKEELASEAGIEVKQLSNWFTNARKRLWQPVLRQSGVEVKNFLSTGRGGPRGNKLDVPPNFQHLIAQKDTPPSSPGRSSEPTTMNAASHIKRSWSEMQSSPAPSSSTNMDEVAPKKKKSAQRKCKDNITDEPTRSLTHTATQLSHELRLALNNNTYPHTTSPSRVMTVASNMATFQELEILAAASLIGLHQQYQPVH